MSKTRKKRTRRVRLTKKPPTFRPEWIEAFMIMMLHRIGGDNPDGRKLTLTVKQLEAFSKASNGKKTEFKYDDETKSITISAPAYDVPEQLILVPGLQMKN